MPRSKSSRAWLQRHFKDPYVKRAQREGARSRAAYKLAELDRRDRLLRPGMAVVDLGAAPGGWAEYAARRIAPGGRVIALDRVAIAPIAGVEFLEGDFTEPAVLDLLMNRIGEAKIDLVMSDMAPNITGIEAADQARSAYLAELALDFAAKTLSPGGTLLLKGFHGEGFPSLYAQTRRLFAGVQVRKPKASRAESREVYIVGKGFKA